MRFSVYSDGQDGSEVFTSFISSSETRLHVFYLTASRSQQVQMSEKVENKAEEGKLLMHRSDKLKGKLVGQTKVRTLATVLGFV